MLLGDALAGESLCVAGSEARMVQAEVDSSGEGATLGGRIGGER